MAKVPVPDDWLNDEWSCVKVSWPNSDQWMGLLQGLLTSVSRGRFWDEKTGSIKEVQAIAFEIMDKTFPFLPCDDDGDSSPCKPDSTSGEVVYSAICEIGLDNMACSIPHGAIKFIDGVLSYRYCDEWYPVEGQDQFPIKPPPVQPGDTDAPELPEGTPDATACSKASVLSDVLFGIVDELLDAAEVPETPTAAIVRVKSRYPFIDFGDTELFSAYLDAIGIVTQGFANETEDTDVQQSIKCQMVGVISDGNQGLTSDERSAVQSSIVTATSSYFSIWTYPTAFGSMNNIYLRSYRSIGPNDTKAITSYATPTGAEDCACPDSPLPPANPDDPTVPDEDGFYLSENLIGAPYSVEVRDHPTKPTEYTEYFARMVASREVRGFAYKVSVASGPGFKTEGYGTPPLPPSNVDVSLSTLQPVEKAQGYYFGAYAGGGEDAILASLAMGWYGSPEYEEKLGFPGNNISTPSYGNDELCGYRYQDHTDTWHNFVVDEFRWILNTAED